MTETDTEKVIAAYGAAWEALTPDGIGDLLALTSPAIRFTDPFNDVTGREGYRAVLEKMFRDVASVRSTVRDIAISGRDPARGYLRWQVAWTAKGKSTGPETVIEGVSEIRVDHQGLIACHFDYWDPARTVYETIPVLGAVLRAIRKTIAA